MKSCPVLLREAAAVGTHVPSPHVVLTVLLTLIMCVFVLFFIAYLQ